MNPTAPPPGPIPPLHRRAPFLRWLFQQHLFGSLAIVLVATTIIASQVSSRDGFASSELEDDVESRWGDQVTQPAPSVRFVQSGTVFTTLQPLALDRQHVDVQAQMNYRKRGLRYFSGFDFLFVGQYEVSNRERHDIDVAFVFPIELNKSQVLLSDLSFLVNGEERALDLGDERNRLVWTGRIARGESAQFQIRYRARGMDSFIYRLDPSLPARDVRLEVSAQGGDNFDYPAGVLSATEANVANDRVVLAWRFGSLESGVTMGVVLPSVKSFDEIISTMASRAWFPFLVFAGIVVALGVRNRRSLKVYDAYLLAAAFGFFFILLAYLAAFSNFYLAYAVASVALGAVVVAYLRAQFPKERLLVLAGLWIATMVIPTAAVILQGYTGLIYTLELLAGLLGLMALSTRESVRARLSDFNFSSAPEGGR